MKPFGKMFAKYYNSFNWADRVYSDRYKGGARPGPGPSLFLDKTEVQRAKKNFLESNPPPPSKGLDDWGPPLSQGLDPALLKKLLFKSNIL